MSEEGGFGIALAEKFFGILLVIIGVLTAYYTFTSFSALGIFTGFFGFLCIILLVIGVLLITAKTE
jgi:uncharacterized membrane protein